MFEMGEMVCCVGFVDVFFCLILDFVVIFLVVVFGVNVLNVFIKINVLWEFLYYYVLKFEC